GRLTVCTNAIVAWAEAERHARASVAKRHLAGDVGADVIAGDDIKTRSGIGNPHAFLIVARDDVSRSDIGGGARTIGTYKIGRRAVVNVDAGRSVRDRERPCDIGADEVALHQVGIPRVNFHAVAAVRTNEIPSALVRSANQGSVGAG